MSKAIDQYFDHVVNIAGDRGRFFKISDDDPSSPVVVAAFKNVPEDGCLTAFSYGLSSADHPEWKRSRPELIISINSEDYSWALAMGEIIKNGRNENLFTYGSILNFGEKISDDSDMSAFLVFACSVLEEEDLEIKLSDRTVHISQIYPIYSEEIPLVKRLGAEEFYTKLDIDFFDVRRMPVRGV
jgi:hypothetical protein